MERACWIEAEDINSALIEKAAEFLWGERRKNEKILWD